MTVTEVLQSLGSWEVRLRDTTPRELLDKLTYFGHVVVAPGRLDPTQYGDSLLTSARYVGVYHRRSAENEFLLRGSGMAYWLGDSDGKGDVFEAPVTLTAETFPNSVRALLPPNGSVTEGTIYSVAGTYTQKHQWVTPRQALDYLTSTFNAEWRVNGNATLDAGLASQLYRTTPVTLLMQKEAGADLLRKALPGRMSMETDVEQYATRVVLLAEGEGTNIATGSANQPTVPYKDLHGNTVKLTKLVSESETSETNADTRAQLALNASSGKRSAVQLSSTAFDIKGDVVVGDYVDVYDPVNGFTDPAREVVWEGQPINPVALRCVELSWPIEAGWTVAFRTTEGEWIDLTPYYAAESGETTITVGDLPRSLSSIGGEDIGSRPNLPTGDGADTSIPAAPTITDSTGGNYQGADGEWTKSAVWLQWSQPLNGDGSTITDGDHYEIRYRVGTYIGYKVRWGALNQAGYRWGELSGNRWGAPITDPIESGDWHTVYVGWDQTEMLIQELTPGVEYEFQVRAVDKAAHLGPWSASEFVIASGDIFAPSAPAAPVVASSPMALQITHTLGKASGGTYNLEPDLSHLTIHIGGDQTFLPDSSNTIGKLVANGGMISAGIPAVGSFQVEHTDAIWVKVVAVDRSGNASPPSAGVQATADLIDDQYISNLSVSKVTAGTITATWIMAGAIKTGDTGARVEIDSTGVSAYNPNGQQTAKIGSDGNVTLTGTVQTSVSGAGVRMVPGSNPRLEFTPNAVDDHRVWLWAMYFNGGNAVEMGVRKVADNSIDGGKLLLMESGSVLSHQPNGGGAGIEQYIGINWPFTGSIYGRGKMTRSFYDNDALMYSEYTPVGAGFSGLSITFGQTMTGTVSIQYSIQSAAAVSHWVTGASNNGYTVSWSDAAAHYVWEWVTRC